LFTCTIAREHTQNEREIKWVKVEVSPLRFLGGEEEGESGERQKDMINSMLVQRSLNFDLSYFICRI